MIRNDVIGHTNAMGSKRLFFTIHRTFPLEEELRQRMSQQRAKNRPTMAAFVQEAIKQHLPQMFRGWKPWEYYR